MAPKAHSYWSRRVGRSVRIVALDDDIAAAVVADRHDAVAVRQRLDGVAVFRRVLPELQGLAVGRDGRRV